MRPDIKKEKFDQVVAEIYMEYLFAVHHYPPFQSESSALHEIVKQANQLRKEILEGGESKNKQAIQLATMAVRYLVDLGKVP